MWENCGVRVVTHHSQLSGGPSHLVAGGRILGDIPLGLSTHLWWFLFFLSTFSSFAQRQFWALSPGMGRVSAARARAHADGLLFAHSRDEGPKAPAAIRPFCSEESHGLHFVVCHPDYHAHQVRSTESVT